MENNFGQILVAARKKKKMSQEELANRLNVTRQTVSNWERGIALPDITLFSRIANELNIDIKTLININPKDQIKKKRKKFIILTFVISILVILTIIVVLIVLNRNKFNLYQVSIDDKNVDINGGVLVLSKDTNFLLIGDIKFTNQNIILDETSTIRIYQQENDEERLILEIPYEENITVKEDYGYNEYFPDNLNLDAIYIDVIIEDGTMTFKLNFKEVIDSDKLMYFKSETIGSGGDDNNSDEDVLSIEGLLENGYSYNAEFNQYTKIENEISWYYKQSMNDLVMEINLDSYSIRGTYDVDKKILSVRIFDVLKDEYTTDCNYFDDGRVESYLGNCSDVKKYQEKMQNEYDIIYKK